MVHEVQGGTSKDADAAVRAIATAVAEHEGRDEGTVRRELLGKVALAVVRTAARAIQKRRAKKPQKQSWHASVSHALQIVGDEDDAVE